MADASHNAFEKSFPRGCVCISISRLRTPVAGTLIFRRPFQQTFSRIGAQSRQQSTLLHLRKKGLAPVTIGLAWTKACDFVIFDGCGRDHFGGGVHASAMNLKNRHRSTARLSLESAFDWLTLLTCSPRPFDFDGL